MEGYNLLTDSILHLFLPKRTPDAAPRNLEKIEEFILDSATLSVSQFIQETDYSELNGIETMLKTWQRLQPFSNTSAEEARFVENFVLSVSSKPVATIPLYVRKQNCTLLIEQPKLNDLIRIETFRAALPSQLVMGSVGPLTMDFPETLDIIQNPELLSSQMFARSLFQLAVNELDVSTPRIQFRGEDQENVRDAPEPFLISEWFTSLLSPLEPIGSQQEMMKYKFSKRIRDQVTLSPVQGSSKLRPFRRSGMWLSIKVALQLQLLKHFRNDEETSKLVYKILLLRILSDLCKSYHEKRDGFKLDLDLAAQTLAKIGRRVHKLQKLPKSESNQLETLRSQTLEQVQKVVQDLHNFMKKAYGMVDEEDEEGTVPSSDDDSYLLPPRSSSSYLSDLHHAIPFLTSYKEPATGIKASIQTLNMTEEVKASLEIQRYPTSEAILIGAPALGDKCLLNERIWLFDTETYLKTKLSVEQDSELITELVQTYVSHSLKLYQGNPIGLSQMILVVLKAVQILDRIATKEHPLLLEYHSGVNCATFDCLILPHKDDMKLLNDTLNYFHRRNQGAAMLDGIITGDIDAESFPVRFAAQTQDMTGVRDDILRKSEEDSVKLLAEVHKVRDLQKEMDRTNRRDCLTLANPKVTNCPCRRCILEKVQTRILKRIALLERPLPNGEALQNAVIFEELIPQNISDLRNCLAILKFGLVEEPIFNVEEHQVQIKWLEYGNLIDYLPWSTRLVRKTGSVINLGSRRLNSLSTHRNPPNILTSGDDYFTVDNGLECVYSYSHSYSFAKIQPITQLRSRCAFQIGEAHNPKPYLSLQRYLESYEHEHNQVIAGQSSCHRDLFLEEFIAFGGLRAGHRIQLRNLYREIASRVLSLEEEPVLALVLQTIWQVGPSAAVEGNEEGGIGVREVHLDFEDEEFSSAFLDVLEVLGRENETNYNHPVILITAVVIVVRIMELNEGMEDRCYSLLKRWRLIIKNWTRKLESELEKDHDSEDLLELQKTLLLARMGSTLSYNFSISAGFRRVMREKEDISEWLHTIAILNQNQKDNNFVTSRHLSKLMQLLLNVGRNVTLRLQLQSHVMNEPLIGESLGQFVSEKWSKAGECLRQSLRPAFETHENLVLLKYKQTEPSLLDGETFWVTFDFILGTFLVNGLMDGRLDSGITGTAIFKRYFQHHTQLRVQKESANVFRTVGRFQGNHYEFRKFQKLIINGGNVDDVLIKEVRKDGSVLTLLEQENFRHHLNPSFVDGYTHWLDQKEKALYFRRLPTEEGDYTMSHDYKLAMSPETNNNKWELFDEKNQSFVMSIKSDGFQNVSTALRSLELRENLNVLMDKGTDLVTAHLPRYGLRFAVNQVILESLEYPDFHLATGARPREGTLIGLEQGIQLKSECKRLLILPNGNISSEAMKGLSHHQTTRISLEEVATRQPPYFVYEFDQVLRRLVANKSKPAWLHLAALHAVTSSSLPDPFTGLTGTEMAVRILQSGFIWSSSPYDPDSLRILEFIKGLSPKRTYYGCPPDQSGAMEVVKWPSGLPSMAAYDGFEIIVDKLIEDSQRLEALYYVDKKSGEDSDSRSSSSSAKLRLRSYFRHLRSYNQGAAVEQRYFTQALLGNDLTLKWTETVRSTKSGKFYLEAASDLAGCRHPDYQRSRSTTWQYKNEWDLFQYLAAQYEADPKGSYLGPVQDILKLDFRTNWFTLYELAKRKQKSEEDKHRFTLILCAMAYKRAPLHQLLNLHYISEYADEFEFPTSPRDISLEAFRNSTYQSASNVTSTFQGILSRYVDYYVNVFDVPEADKWHLPESQRRSMTAAATISQEMWPCTAIPNTAEVRGRLVGFKQENVLSEINGKLREWEALAEPRKFAEEVQRKLNEIYWKMPILAGHRSRAGVRGMSPVVGIGRAGWRCGIQFEEFLGAATPNEELFMEARRLFETGAGVGSSSKRGGGGSRKDSTLERRLHSAKAQNMMKSLLEMMGSSTQGKILGWSGLLPRTDPTSLLRKLIHDDEGESCQVLKTVAGALAVIWTKMKRLNRILFYTACNQTVELERELGNEGHENWSPKEYPEWVLLELELDVMIRGIQVDVAERMMTMPDHGGNGIMQLNMGEGKTSVIVPMLCSTLSRKGEQLCRVTVLGSIFNTNYATLSFAIGGLLNRRIYTVPCKRDMAIDGCLVDRIQNVYEECLEMKGTVLTLPEYRLSFRLLAYDKILKQEIQLGLKLHQTENWLRENARDVLDEADELLNVKYQLIYTIGGQAPLDGGDIRWVTCQKLLKIVQVVGAELDKRYGGDNLEFNRNEWLSKPYQFAPVRLLDRKIHEEFVGSVADLFLEEEILTQEEKLQIKRFLTEGEIEEEALRGILRICGESSELLSKILVTSGFLRRGVLTLGLSKRWRVEYGVDVAKSQRQMAVPFRAKDVAAERTEFGHPDLAILLTHLSYYYSGLSNHQLDYVMKLIKMRKGADAIYGSWIEQMPQVPGSLTTLQGINLKDAGQRSELYSLLIKHKSVIDFWLSNKVFPNEAKEFPAKLVMTAWDLCFERQKHPITGFSGTNDTSVLLPLPVAQQDLPELLDTNKKVEGILLQPENRGHRNLEMGVGCKKILNLMKEDNLTVLIDAGALMLQCSNEQLVEMWLEVNPELEATLYFNQDNNLMVKSRRRGSGSRGQSETSDVPFELSSFTGRLDKCGVFLDDQHTRGTDIKFPVGARACVTIGGKMKRDKLIQACMRMRKLGCGHSVTFYLSHEASGRIQMTSKEDKMETKNVLEWVSKNTQAFNEDGLLYWATSGKNYAQRLAAEDNFEFQDEPNILGEQCKDLEVIKLMELYGKYIEAGKLVHIIPQWFDGAMSKLEVKNGNTTLPPNVTENFNRIRDEVVGRCRQHIPSKLHFSGSNMEEEQERELEPEKEMEMEEEVQIEREEVNPAKHDLHRNVEEVVLYGRAFGVMEGIQRLCDIFKATTFWGDVQPEGWGDEVYATEDFITVIADKGMATDDYLRPIEYVISGMAEFGSGNKTLVLSPFEVNKLLPRFRNGNVASHLHMFSPRRVEKQDVLLNEGRLLLPKGCDPVAIPEDSRNMSALLLASGNLYFRNMAEQRAFALFVSLAPQPWSEEEKEAFDNELITKTVFMMPHYRVGDGVGERPFAFGRDPSALIRRNLTCRHAVLSEMAHVIRLLNEKVYVDIRGEEED